MLYREIPYMMELLGEILTQSKMGDTRERLREIIGEARSGQQASKLAAGHLIRLPPCYVLSGRKTVLCGADVRNRLLRFSV